MSFDLRISFTGLCLFVPKADEDELSVVLPSPKASKMQGAGAMQMHRASVFYSSVYETGESAPSTSFREVLLTGSINLPGGKVTSTGPSQISAQALGLANILDVADAAYPGVAIGEFRNLKPEALGQGEDVTAVITLRGGRLLSYNASYPWYLPTRADEPRTLAWKVDWLIQGIDADTLPYSWLGGAADRRDGGLRPFSNVIELRVKNVPVEESMPEDVPYKRTGNATESHAAAFYKLLKGEPVDHDVPTFGAPKDRAKVLGGLITCTPGMATLGT